MNPQQAALLCALPLSVGIVVDSLELLADRRHLREGGLYGYAVLATGRRIFLTGPLAPLFRMIFRYPNVLGLAIAQIAAAGVLAYAAVGRSPAWIVPAGAAALVMCGARMLLYLRNQLGLDGSDQMMLVVCTGIAAACFVPEGTAQTIAVDYVALQLLLSYSVAGVAKVVSVEWRAGRALGGIMSTIGYGVPRLGRLLQRSRRLSLLLNWSVIIFECSAPCLVLAGTKGAIVVIAVGVSFHISVALLMGLNNFLWSFTAAYPALLLLAQSTDRIWR